MRKTWLLLSISILMAFSYFPAFAEDESYLYKVAVLPFDDSSIQNRWWGDDWEVGKGVSDMFVTELLNTNRFKVVEREQINQILDEQKFGASGLVDSNSAAELGRILGVKYLIMGKVTEFTNDSNSTALTDAKNFGLAFKTTYARVSIDVRMVETSTAEIKTGVTGKGEKKKTNLGVATDSGAIIFGSSDFLKTNLGLAMRDAVSSAVNQLTVKAYENFTITGIIAYVDPERIIIDAGAEKGVQPGMVFEVIKVIKEILHPVTNEVLDQITETIGEITVVEVKEKSATCSVLTKNGEFAVTDRIQLKKGASPQPSITAQETKTSEDTDETEKPKSKKKGWK